MADQHILAHISTSTTAITLISSRKFNEDVLDLIPTIGEEIVLGF